jgi:hypothetical protein
MYAYVCRGRLLLSSALGPVGLQTWLKEKLITAIQALNMLINCVIRGWISLTYTKLVLGPRIENWSGVT